MHTVSFPRENSTFTRKINILMGDETVVSVRNLEKRIEARNMLDDIQIEYEKNGKSAKFFVMTNNLYWLLLDHFLPTIPPTEIDQVEEIRAMLRGGYKNIKWYDRKWKTCYNSTFAIYIVRDALKNRQLPLVQASGWKEFATNYCSLVMAA